LSCLFKDDLNFGYFQRKGNYGQKDRKVLLDHFGKFLCLAERKWFLGTEHFLDEKAS
jgi:hypothetical protein